MDEIAAVRYNRISRIAGRVAVPIIIVLITAYFCHVGPGTAANLVIVNDEVDYAVGAATWFETGSYRVPLGGKFVAPQYPYGFPLMSLPFFFLSDSIGAPVICVLACAIGIVLLTYSIGRTLGGTGAGVIAAFLVLAVPLFRRMSGHILADIPSTFLFYMVLWSLLAARKTGVRRRKISAICVASVCAGLSIAVRLNAVLIILPLVFFACAHFKSQKRAAASSAAAFAIGIALFAVPLLIFNSMHFGSPLRTGYSAWASWIHDRPGYAFSFRHLLSPALSWPPGAAHGNAAAYACSLFTFFGETMRTALDYTAGILTFFLAVTGAVLIARGKSKNRMLLLLAGLFLVPYFIFFLLFFYQHSRFLLPLLPFLSVLAAVGACRTLAFSLRSRGRTRIVLLALFTAAGLIVLNQHIKNLFRFEIPQAEMSANYESVQALNRNSPENAVIVSAFYPVYVERLVIRGTNRELHPLNDRGPVFMRDRPNRPPENPSDALALGGAVFYPPPAASAEGINSLLEETRNGREIFMDGKTYREHPRSIQLLKEYFDFEAKGSAGTGRIYRLIERAKN